MQNQHRVSRHEAIVPSTIAVIKINNVDFAMQNQPRVFRHEAIVLGTIAVIKIDNIKRKPLNLLNDNKYSFYTY